MKKLPVGIQDFASLISDDYLFVDKTSLLYELVNTGRHYFLSRPRRFGKSLLVSVLKYYFEGRKDLFDGLAVSSLETEWAAWPVLHIDLSPENYSKASDLEARLNKYLCAWEREYGAEPSEVSLSSRFEGVISRAAAKTGRRAVILVDEYDKPLLSSIGNRALQDQYRSILKAFYGVLKSQDGNIRFSFLTGVTKFSKVSIFSDLNNLNDISRDRAYAGLSGITQEEMEGELKPYLEEFASVNAVSYGETLARFRRMYDGYHFSSSPVGVYNPFSVLSALLKMECRGYWFETGTPSYLVKLIKDSNLVLEDMVSHPFPVERLDGSDGDAVPVLFQSGYLSISRFTEDGDCLLEFPNDEVREGFFKFIFPYFAPVRGGSNFEISRFVSDLKGGNIEAFLKRLQSFFADFDYTAQESPEAHYRNVLFILCKLLGLQSDAEYQTSDGRIDLLVRTSSYIYVMEFKLDGSADAALAQIKDKEYALPWTCDGRSIIRVGLNFNSDKRRLEDWKIDFSGLTPQATPQAAPQVTPQALEILRVLEVGEMTVSELISALGLTDRKYFRMSYLAPAIDAGLVLPAYPDKPTHPRQKYLLTELGRFALKRK